MVAEARETVKADRGMVPLEAILMMSMAVATNAAKYGALARIDVTLGAKANGIGPRLLLCWLEQNGPPVLKPTRQGFGTLLLERGIQTELGGKTLIEFAPAGVRCEIDIPLTGDEE